MITATDKNTKVTCNNCKKNTFTVDGARSKRKAYTKAIELGWRWKDAGTHVCPSCRKADKPVATPKVKTLTGKGAKTKLNTSKTTKSGAKVTIRKTGKTASSKPSGLPFSGGQSIGKIAKTAKVAAANPAE